MSGVEAVLSVLAIIITTLVGMVVHLVLRAQNKFEERMEKHIHDLREQIQACNSQILVLRTLMITQLPVEVQERLNAMLEKTL